MTCNVFLPTNTDEMVRIENENVLFRAMSFRLWSGLATHYPWRYLDRECAVGPTINESVGDTCGGMRWDTRQLGVWINEQST